MDPRFANARSPFASASLSAHLARGLVGALLLWWAVELSAMQPWASVAAGALALVAFRGCPVCWTLGLVETVARRLRVGGSARPSRGSGAELP